ncbi:MAG: hypothetical protein IJQ21_11790, partial [Lachnospiraceae bacterium]|nr:hypothetical protein [Lachnospiraceae bacterium]
TEQCENGESRKTRGKSKNRKDPGKKTPGTQEIKPYNSHQKAPAQRGGFCDLSCFPETVLIQI